MTQTKDSDNWATFPVVRTTDKTIMSFIDKTDEGIPVHVRIELDKQNAVVAKVITPLNELFA